MDSVYFVASNDQPEVIYFSPEEAFASGFEYLDAFDEEGNFVISYKLKAGEFDDTDEDDYTTNF